MLLFPLLALRYVHFYCNQHFMYSADINLNIVAVGSSILTQKLSFSLVTVVIIPLGYYNLCAYWHDVNFLNWCMIIKVKFTRITWHSGYCTLPKHIHNKDTMHEMCVFSVFLKRFCARMKVRLCSSATEERECVAILNNLKY